MSGDRPLESDLDDDIRACRALAGHRAEAAVELEGPPPGLAPKLEAALAEERGLRATLRERPTRERIAIVLGATLFAGGATLLLTPRPDLGGYPRGHLLAVAALFAGVTAAAAARLLRPLHRPRPRPLFDRLLLAAGLLLPVLTALFPVAGHTGMPAGEGAAFFQRCAACLGYGLAVAAPVLFLAFALRRSPHDRPAVAALAGVSAGLGANLALQLHCPITAASHLLASHASVVLLVVLIALAWRR